MQMTVPELHHLVAIQRALLKESETCLTKVAHILGQSLAAYEVAIYTAETSDSSPLQFRCTGHWSSTHLSSTQLLSLLSDDLAHALQSQQSITQTDSATLHVLLPICRADEVLGGVQLWLPHCHQPLSVNTPFMQSALEALADYAKRRHNAIALLQAQAELIALRESALDTALAKSMFLAGISHEIRTPMNVMLGMSDMLLDTPLSPEQASYLRTLRHAGHTLAAFLTDLIDFSQLESGKLELSEQPFALLELLQHLERTFAPKAAEKKLQFRLVCPSYIPSVLLGDAQRIQQILAHLISNAIKFTEKGLVEVSAELEHLDETLTTVRFAVSDTGIGIAADKLDFIFEQFTQLALPTTRKHSGIGLGLTIARQLVEKMKGELWVESTLGKGSCFYVRLPLQRVPAWSQLPSPLAGKAALLIDHDPSSQAWFRHYFASRCVGLHIITHLDALSGARFLDSSPLFSWVLVNCHLPEAVLRSVHYALLSAQPEHAPVAVFFNAHRKADLLHVQHTPNAQLLYTLSEAELDTLLNNRIFNHTRSTMHAVVTPLQSDAPADAQLKILVADDARDNQLLIKAYFKKQPFAVHFASNGYEALAQFKSSQFDLVLMDLQMPDLDGYATTAAMRQWEVEMQRPRTPIIALTAFALPEEQTRALEAGCDAYLTKPIKKEVLLDAIYTHCHRYAENHRAY